jgi:glycosyltransferase involved in cell wall biosynthesis
VPIVYDFDDAIFRSNVSDANRQLAWLKWPQKAGAICGLSTHVIAGNEYLRQYASQFNAGVSIVPTTIDTDAYTLRQGTALHDPPVIGWTGSLTTIKHLETITEVLKELRKSFRFRFKVFGADRFTIPGLEIESVPWTAASEIAHLTEFDIGIMPLPDDDWSRGKCGLKALQYMALGIPVVASAVGVNSDIITDGRNGFLASSRAEWVEKLLRLLTDPALRRKFSDQGRMTIESRYSARVQAPRVLEIFEAACRDRRHTIGDVNAVNVTRP